MVTLDYISDETPRIKTYLVDYPLDSIVNIIYPINFISLWCLARVKLVRSVSLCSQKSIAGLQNTCRSVFFSERANDGTACNSSRSVGKGCE
jgi:hypothetical protein